MSAAALPDTAAIDVALAKGEWWLRLFDELSALGRRRSEAVRNRGGRWPSLGDLARFAMAVSLAVVAAIRLRGHLKDLARRRALAPADPATPQAAHQTARPAPAPESILLARWEPAPQTFLPRVPQDPPGRTTWAADTAMPLARASAPTPPPSLPPRPG